MKLTKFIKRSIDIVENKSFTIKEKDKFLRTISFHKTLKSFNKDVTLEDVCLTMENEKFCPNLISEKHKCKGMCCYCCWEKFILEQTKSFPRLAFITLVSDKSKEDIDFVKSDKYLNWVYNFVSNKGYIDSEDILYSDNETDVQMGKHIGLFNMYIADLIEDTDFENLANPDEYESERYQFKLFDKYFDICTIFGQGSVTFINEIKGDNIPNDCLVLK